MAYADILRKQIEDSERLFHYFCRNKEDESKINLLSHKILLKAKNLDILTRSSSKIGIPYGNTKLSEKSYNVSDLIDFIEKESFPYREKLDIDRKFGHELEFTGISLKTVEQRISFLKDKSLLQDGYCLKEDCTVSQKDDRGHIIGGEIATPPLKDETNTWKELQVLCENLIELGAQVNLTCGGHIHMNIERIKEDPIAFLYFLKAYAVFEPILFSFFLGDFSKVRTELWKRRSLIVQLCTAFQSIPAFSFYDWKLYPQLLKSDLLRIKNAEKTLEFRCPNPSLSPFIIQNNVNVLGKMLDKIEKDSTLYPMIDEKFNALQTLPFRVYTEVDLELAFLFCDSFFDCNVDKLYFLKQYLFCHPKIREDYLVCSHGQKVKMMVK